MTNKELSEVLNINISTIKGFRNKNKIYSQKIFKPDKKEFVELLNRYKNCNKVAEFYNVSKTTVLRYAKKIGYNTSKNLLLSAEDLIDICNKYHTHTARELALWYGVSESRIHQVWMQNDLKGKEKRVYKINQHAFDIVTQEVAYLLGFIASDGCIFKPKENNKQNIVRITIQKEDEEILRLFQRVLETNKPISYIGNYATFEISSNLIVEQIEKIGISERKTYGNTIANIPDEYMFHFITLPAM